ncbi:unnamed protein product, partial [Mesorhabditis spiculigera]
MHPLRLPAALPLLATLSTLSLLISTSLQNPVRQRQPDLLVYPGYYSSEDSTVLLRPVKRSHYMEVSDEVCELKKKANVVLAQVLEEVCALCHELYSHSEANVRSRCRANCFNNEMVGKCMQRFSPKDFMNPDNFEF